MKILYGVQGTGNGHIARARAMANAFAAQHCQVDFLFLVETRSAISPWKPLASTKRVEGSPLRRKMAVWIIGKLRSKTVY